MKHLQPTPDDQWRSCYVNFAGHLLNAYNPNMLHPGLPHRWRDEDWFAFLDMIAAFGFNIFEFWLVPAVFGPDVDSEMGRAFTRQMAAIIDHGARKQLRTKMLVILGTVGPAWHTHCPNVEEEWRECVHLWKMWTRRFPDLGIVSIFPGDPGGCSRNGCTPRTFIDRALEVTEVVQTNCPGATVELNTWGPPFFGWGNLRGPDRWAGEFVQSVQHTGWDYDAARASDAMEYLIERLPSFPPETRVAINMGFNSDGNPELDDGRQDARFWANEISKTNRIVSWDFSLTEGESGVFPHYRFNRLFEQRRREMAAAPYTGGICFTITPLLNQLSLYMAAQSFLDPHADPSVLTRRFHEQLFVEEADALLQALPLFEVIPEWGNYEKVDIDRASYHRHMTEAAECLRDITIRPSGGLPFHPSPEAYRQELLFFLRLFAELSGSSCDYRKCKEQYRQRVYGIYDRLPVHVDPRPELAAERLVGFFDPAYDASAFGPIPGKWTE